MTKMSVTRYKTNRDDLLFVGYDGYEEFYQEVGKTGGWFFMGLRPGTEEELRRSARDTDIREYCTIPPFLEKYIDEEAFADDMEADWYDRYDIQAEREDEDGTTVYLGFGTRTDVKHYFKDNRITDYESFCYHFQYVGLNKKEFDKFLKTYNV